MKNSSLLRDIEMGRQVTVRKDESCITNVFPLNLFVAIISFYMYGAREQLSNTPTKFGMKIGRKLYSTQM